MNKIKKYFFTTLVTLSFSIILMSCGENNSALENNSAPEENHTEEDNSAIENNPIVDNNSVIEEDCCIESVKKPVIYLYPEMETEVTVKLDYDGELTCTYPLYEDEWVVTALPDGTLVDEKGQSYNYLYWEGLSTIECDFSEGFCVPGEQTAEFLEKALEQAGLSRKEANEFIIYWLPMMQENPYNVISFQTEQYTEHAKLEIAPQPDTLIRVFMAWYGTEKPVTITEQQLEAVERRGFTVVEWGGCEVDNEPY